MKISKTAVLTAGSALMIAGLGLMFVSAADKNLYVDPNNAIQHFEKVRIVPIESGDNSMADIVKKGNLFGIETDYNFALSRSGTDANQISGNTMGSSILGGIVNRILGGIYNGILGGKNNKITTGNNNGILGGENNEIGGNYSVIFGGKGNEIGGSGSYSAIVGGSGNKINGSYSVVVGRNNNTAKGYNSVAMGSGSKLNATSSFLWTDGIYSGNFTTNHVFAVLGDKGMVINATGAHDLAQLTISGVLVVYDDKNAPKCTPETKGVLKVVTGDNSTTNQECFCSCDGSGRNVLHEGSNCVELCKDDDLKESPQCGDVIEDCNRPYHYTGGSEGACVKGQLIRGTGAFFVSSTREGTGLINYINRSCQVAGEITGCQKELVGDSCPNLFTGYECLGKTGNHWLTNDIKPRDSATRWEYSETGYDNKPCKYICDEYSHWDSRKEECIPNECGALNDSNAHFNPDTELPTVDGKEPEYKPGSKKACTYDCNKGYAYDNNQKLCRELACNKSTLPEHALENTPRSGDPTGFSQDYKYKESGHDPCTFRCEKGYTYNAGECVNFSCKEPRPSNSVLNNPEAKPDVEDKEYFYSETSTGACAYHCASPYVYVEGQGCVLNQQNCSVDLVEGKYGINDLAAGHKASTLGSSGPWTCTTGSDGTLRPFADTCDSDIVSSFDNTVSSVKMNEGYVFLSWIDENGRVLSNTLNALSLNCGEKAILKWKCDEDNDYGRNPEKRYCEKGFKPVVYTCEGEDPKNATLIPGTDEGLPNSGIVKYVYENSTEARGKYCAYLCDSGYTYVLNHNRPQCVICMEGTYNPETKSCEIKQGCGDPGYAYGSSPRNDGGYACLREGYCRWNNNSRPESPDDSGADDVNFWDARPIGDNDGDWKCVVGTPERNACQYTCQDGYLCRNGRCKEIDCKFPINQSNLYGSTLCDSHYTDKVDWIVKGLGGGEWQHVGVNQSFPDDDGCYYKCPKGSYYGTYCSKLGCVKNKCADLPSYLDSKRVETVERPDNPNERLVSVWEYSGTITEDTQAWGCYYKCKSASGFVPTIRADGKVECVGGECPAVTKKNLYGERENDDVIKNGYTLQVVTGMVVGGSAWKHIDEGAPFPKNETGCYYSCTGNTYFGRYNSAYNKGCMRRECPGLPRYLSSDSIVPTGKDPKRYQNHNSEGNSVHDDDWTYLSGSVPTRSGCFYRCNIEKGYREVLVEVSPGVYATGCTNSVCPLQNKYFTYGNNYSWFVFPVDYYTGGNGWITHDPWMWQHISEDEPIPDEDGCYYKCPEGSYYGLYLGDEGCLEYSCDTAPAISNIEKFPKPGKYDQSWTYSGTMTSQTQATGCFYKCASGYNPEFKTNGDLEKCVKKIVEPEDPCIDTNGNFNTGNKAYCCELEEYKPYCCKFKEEDDKPYCCELEEYKYDEEYCVPYRKSICDTGHGFIWDDENKECKDKCEYCSKNVVGDGCGWNPYFNGCTPNVADIDCSDLGAEWHVNGKSCVYCPVGTWTPGVGEYGGACV